MSEILTCEALTKCYDKDKTALDGVDLHVNFGSPRATRKKCSSSWP